MTYPGGKTGTPFSNGSLLLLGVFLGCILRGRGHYASWLHSDDPTHVEFSQSYLLPTFFGKSGGMLGLEWGRTMGTGTLNRILRPERNSKVHLDP